MNFPGAHRAPRLTIERGRGRPIQAAPGVERHAVLRALALLTLGWMALFAPQIFARRVFVAGDAALFRRFSEFSRQRWITEHERTFWNPYVFLGIPASASLADQRPQFLPDRALDQYERLRSRPWLPPLAGPLLAHLTGVLAMALLVRALWGARLGTMLWAGSAWALLPALLVPLTFGHDAQFVSASLLPATLLLTHALFAWDARPSAWAAVALGPLLGIQCQFGHPQVVAVNAVMFAAFAIERAFRFRRAHRLGLALGAAFTGAMMSAAMWWPAMRYGALSVRGGETHVSALEVASFSQAWRDLLSLAWPHAVGFGGQTYWGGLRKTDYPQFAGTLVCVLALLAWPRRGRRERGIVPLLAAFALLGVALSLGSNLPGLDGLLRAAIPPFASFRVPVSWLLFTQPSLILLSALALERISERGAARDAVVRTLQIAASLGAFAVMTGFTLAWAPLHDVVATWARELRPALTSDQSVIASLRAELDLVWRGLMVGAAIALWLWSGRASGSRWALAGVVALEVADLGGVSVPFLLGHTGRASRLAAAPAPPLALAAAADARARAMPLDRASASTNDWVAWRARCVIGVHGAIDRDWSDLMSAGFQRRYQALCAFAVRYTTVPAGTPPAPGLWSTVRTGGTDSVVRLTGARDRAYFVTSVGAPGSHAGVLAALLSDDFRADRALAEDVAIAGSYPGSAEARLRWLEDSPDRLRFESVTRAPAFLVVADPMLPGWTALVDGRTAQLHRVDFLLRGLPVPTGIHSIEMRYLPPGWRPGAALARAGCLLALAAMLAVAGWQVMFARREPGANTARAA